jgi:hypothetical protein
VIEGMKHIRDQPLILFGIICFLFVLIKKKYFYFFSSKKCQVSLYFKQSKCKWEGNECIESRRKQKNNC